MADNDSSKRSNDEDSSKDGSRRKWVLGVIALFLTAVLLTGGFFLTSEATEKRYACQNVEDPSVKYSGSGEVYDPYQIENLTQLQGMNECQASLDAHYELVNDIDATPTQEWNDGNGFEPIGGEDRSFTGSLDGEGHSIEGLAINRHGQDYTSMFGKTGYHSTIENVVLTNVDIDGRRGAAGALVEHHTGTVENSSVSGTVRGGSSVGGLIAFNDAGNVTGSTSTAEVSGGDEVGSLVGKSYAGSIRESSASGGVSGDYLVGGLVGNIVESSVTNSTASGNVSGDEFVGGLVGRSQSSFVTNSTASGTVSGEGQTVGGLIGSRDS
jgi:hypothetical protein